MVMIEPLQLTTLIGLGFILGLKHTLDADHVVAVSTIVSQVRGLKKSSLIGIMWGVGHTTTLLLVGLVVLIFKLVIPNKIALSLEFLVGFVLAISGISVFRKTAKEKIHLHKHDNIVHTHFHSHKGSPSRSHIHKSLMIGTLHGLGDSAALMLLVLTTMKSMFQGLLYILIFGFSSILGMLIVSGIVGSLFLLITTKFEKIYNTIEILAGTISIILGFTIMYEIGLINGLFMIEALVLGDSNFFQKFGFPLENSPNRVYLVRALSSPEFLLTLGTSDILETLEAWSFFKQRGKDKNGANQKETQVCCRNGWCAFRAR